METFPNNLPDPCDNMFILSVLGVTALLLCSAMPRLWWCVLDVHLYCASLLGVGLGSLKVRRRK